MSEEKKSEVTEEVKEARKLSMEELEQVVGGVGGNNPEQTTVVSDSGKSHNINPKNPVK